MQPLDGQSSALSCNIASTYLQSQTLSIRSLIQLSSPVPCYKTTSSVHKNAPQWLGPVLKIDGEPWRALLGLMGSGVGGGSYERPDCESLRILLVASVGACLELGNTAWSPRSGKDEKLLWSALPLPLRRATKRIPGLRDLGYRKKLAKDKIPSMAYTRARGDMTEVQVRTLLHELCKVGSPLLLQSERETGTRNNDTTAIWARTFSPL